MPYDETYGGRITPRRHYIEHASDRGDEVGEEVAGEEIEALDPEDFEALAEAINAGPKGSDAVDEILPEPLWMIEATDRASVDIIEGYVGDVLEEAAREHPDDRALRDELIEAFMEGAHDAFWSAVHQAVEEAS